MYDVAIIGAGAVGCAAAMELSKYELSVCVIEKNSDVCEGTTKANSAIAHAGFDAKPGTLKAKLNVRGSKLMGELAEKLDFVYKQNGAMVLCFDENDISGLEELKKRAELNGVQGVSIITGDKARELEPSLTDSVCAALLAETSAIICPFEMTLAFAENACENGVVFRLSSRVEGISKSDKGFVIKTSTGEVTASIVINAAGLYADEIHSMVSSTPLGITARRGEYLLMDKAAGGAVSRTIFQLPTKMGKGVLVTPTVHGNLLVGPTADNIEDKDDVSTTSKGLGDVKAKASLSVKNIPFGKVITSFSGNRAVGDTGDFIIQQSDVKGFIDAAGIESPGLTSAPAVGEYLCEIVSGITELKPKNNYKDTRKGIVHFNSLSYSERNELIKNNAAYGKIVCRCETVTEGEILDAINRPLGATTLDGVKRRTRAGMGRCQAGFCSPVTMKLLAEKLGIKVEQVRKNGVYDTDRGHCDE